MTKLKELALEYSCQEVKSKTQSVLYEADCETKRLLEIPVHKRTLENTLFEFHQTESKVAELSCQLQLISMVHSQPDLRNLATQLKGTVRDWFVQRYGSSSLYQAIEQSLLTSTDKQQKDTTRNLIDSTRRLFTGNGAGLESDRMVELLAVRQRITSLENEFQRNLGEDLSQLQFTRSELQGCPDSFLDSLQLSDDDSNYYIVTMKPPHVRGVLEFCGVEDTRRRVYVHAASRCKQSNPEILADLAKLRAEAAHLLGYRSWAEYKLKPTMASNCKQVSRMLCVLARELQHKARQNLDLLRQVKLRDSTEPMSLWDTAYYERIYLDQNFGIDKKLVRRHFPLEFCIRRVMNIYEYLFQIKFEQITDPKTTIAWNPQVMVFAVKDRRKSLSLLGHLYLDLFARPGKYSHQCVIPLAPSYLDSVTGTRQLPIIANISNLSTKAPNEPFALLAHGEVITFFHEFGHAVHALLSQVDSTIQSWSWNAVPYAAGVEIDFLEVPSKEFEFFAWQQDVLERVSVDTAKISPKQLQELIDKPIDSFDEPVGKSPFPLPRKSVIEQLQKTEYLFAGYSYMRMVFMTIFDMLIHSIPYEGAAEFDSELKSILPDSIKNKQWTISDLNSEQMLLWWQDLQLHFTGLPMVSGTNPLANWYHLAMGYDAGYYGYLWSETLAADLFHTLFDPASKKQSANTESSCLNKDGGASMRDKLLSLGASLPANEMIENLLGRSADPKALLSYIMANHH